MPTPLTDAIEALTTYANTVTGKTPPDTTLSDAVATLASGYGGGLPSTVLSVQGITNSLYNPSYISSGNAPVYSSNNTTGIYISPGGSRIQVAYLRFGPVDVTNIATIQSAVRIVTSGTLLSKIFIDTDPNARSYEVSAIDPDRVKEQSVTSSAYSVVTLDVSNYTGNYYIYVGTDSNGENWTNSRNINIYSATMTETV